MIDCTALNNHVYFNIVSVAVYTQVHCLSSQHLVFGISAVFFCTGNCCRNLGTCLL